MDNYSKHKSGSGKRVFFIISLIIACIAASNFIGPGKGWFKKISKGKENNNKIVIKGLPEEKPEPTKPVKLAKVTENGKKVDSKTGKKSEVKELYDSLFTKYRKKYPDPTVGKEYNVYLKTGRTRGTLKDFSEGKIIIKKPGVTVTYRLDTVSRKSYPELFPKKAAQILALKELKKIREERKPGNEEREIEKNMPAGSVISENKTPEKAFAYQPGAQSSPKRLQKPLNSFAKWISAHQRRVGGKLGEKVYAKQQGRNVVLYMQTSKLFDRQSYDVRFTTTEAMWQIWGFKCLDYGVAGGTSQTHIVLVDRKNRIVGGSRKDDSSDIWVKK